MKKLKKKKEPMIVFIQNHCKTGCPFLLEYVSKVYPMPTEITHDALQQVFRRFQTLSDMFNPNAAGRGRIRLPKL
jgi:hypothetical protein